MGNENKKDFNFMMNNNKDIYLISNVNKYFRNEW